MAKRISQDLPPILEEIGIAIEPEPKEIVTTASKEILHRVKARPAKYAGREIAGDNIRPPDIPTISEEAKVLIIEASQDNNGVVLRLRTFGGTTVQTNGKQLAEQGNRRAEVAWESAVDQLESLGFLEDRAMKGEVFFITHEGYQIVDYLQQSS